MQLTLIFDALIIHILGLNLKLKTGLYVHLAIAEYYW